MAFARSTSRSTRPRVGWEPNERELLSRVILPAALPSILNGVRQSMGIAWVLVVVAEIFAVRSGLGYLLERRIPVLPQRCRDRRDAQHWTIGIPEATSSWFSSVTFCSPGTSGETFDGLELILEVGGRSIRNRWFRGHRTGSRSTWSCRKRKSSTLVGASGCGKSTLLNLIAGFETPTGRTGSGGWPDHRRAGARPGRGLSANRFVSVAVRSRTTSPLACRCAQIAERRTRSRSSNACCNERGCRLFANGARPNCRAACVSARRSRACWPSIHPRF